MISQETIDTVLDRADIVSLVQEYVPDLAKKGVDYVCRCPFHQERTASFHVSPARQSWHCFGACAEGGNAIGFLMKMEALTFPQAVQNLAKRYGVECYEAQETDDAREQRLQREAMWGINERAAAYYASRLFSPEGKDALAYAVERFGEDFVREAGLGFADALPRSFCDWAIGRGENIDLLLKTSLVGCNEQKGYYYYFFRNRLLFPIRDRSRHVLGFTARDLSGENECKYLNSKESPAYHKKESVFGIDAAWREAARKEMFFCVEGAPDVARMQAVGIYNTVAPLGGAWTREQLATLRKAADCLCFINDADPPKQGEEYGPGIAYVMKNGRLALEQGFAVSVRELPLAAGGIQIAAIKKQHAAESSGYYEGGFTGGSDYRRRAGIVHQGELVALHLAVQNPNVLPFLRLIDHAQRNNTIASLSAADVSRAIAAPQATANATTATAAAPALQVVDTASGRTADAIVRLNENLEAGIRASVSITGEDGFERQWNRYNKMKNRK